MIDHTALRPTQERQPKLISSERVICQLDFHHGFEVPHTCSFRVVTGCQALQHVLSISRGQLQHYHGTITTQCPRI